MARRPIVVVLAVITPTLAACEPAFEPGRGVNVMITSCQPDDCYFGDPMVPGLDLSLRFTHFHPRDFDFRETRLVSSDPGIAEVLGYETAAEEARARIVLGAVGPFALNLVDADDNLFASATAEVRLVDHLAFIPRAFGPVTVYHDGVDGSDDPRYSVEAGTLLDVDVVPYGGGDPLGGNLVLEVDVDEPGVPPEDRLAPLNPDQLANSHFGVVVTRGDHDLWVEAPGTGGSGRVRLTGL